MVLSPPRERPRAWSPASFFFMRPHRGRIQEQGAGPGERFGLQVLPEPLPDPARFPAPEAHVNGMPIAQLGRQIPPRAAGALEMEDRFEELSVGHFAGRAGLRMLGCSHGRFELLPDRMSDYFTHRMLQHPKLQSRTRIIVHIIIREHCLDRIHRIFRILRIYAAIAMRLGSASIL